MQIQCKRCKQEFFNKGGDKDYSRLLQDICLCFNCRLSVVPDYISKPNTMPVPKDSQYWKYLKMYCKKYYYEKEEIKQKRKIKI